MIKLAPSILSADFSRLGEEVKAVEAAGADYIHIDVMDGHFVPNITMGPLVVKAVKKMTRLPLDVHLMISDPEKYITAFAEAGSDIISFHAEACADPVTVAKKIKALGKKAALAVNPGSKYVFPEALLKEISMALFMTVFPGFEGQKFIASVLPDISAFRKKINGLGLDIDIEVDGGINAETAKQAVNAGANVLVAGSAVYHSGDYRKAMDSIRNAGK